MASSQPDLDGKDEYSSTGHHVEEEDHGLILMRGVRVENSLGHHVTLDKEERPSRVR